MGELQGGDLRQVDHAAAADRDDHVGASALALRQRRVDGRGRHVDGGLGEDRDVQRGERVEDRGEARRLRDHGIGDDQHAAPVLGGDVARRRGHAGSEQHLGRRAQDGEVGHRSVSRNEVIRGLNSSVRSSGEACPQRPEHVAADVRQRLQQRQEAVAQRHHAVLRAVHQQDRRGDPLELRAREREVVDPALARRREQLPVPRLRQRRAVARLDGLRRRGGGVVVDQLDQRARPLGARRGVAPQGVEAGGQRHGVPHRADRDDPGHRVRAGGRDRERDRRARRVADHGERRDAERVDELERLPGPRRAERAFGPGTLPEAEQIGRDHPMPRRQRRDERVPCRGRRPRTGAVQQEHGRPGDVSRHRVRPGRRRARAPS